MENLGHRDALIICNTYCFSTATMVTLKCLNVTLYSLCLPCLKLCKSVNICIVLLLLNNGIVSSYSLSRQGYMSVLPHRHLQWADSVSKDFSELSVNKIHQSGNQAPLSCIYLRRRTRRNIFRLYNQSWGMNLGKIVCVCLYSCIGKKYTAFYIRGITFSSAVI